jgi:hypothetical protein
VRTQYGQAASRIRGEARYANTRFLVSEKVSRVSVARQEQLNGHAVIVIIAVTPDGVTRTLFFDRDSHLLVKDQWQTNGIVEERFFDDYRPVDQVREPHRIEWHRNGDTFRIAVERVIHNAPVDDEAFDPPAAPMQPSVDIAAVLSMAGLAEQRAERVRMSYAYTQSLSVRVMDEKGGVTDDFSNIRRESMGRRAAIVMDFRPRAGVTPTGDVERQASRMAGTLWIDEASQEVIRIESHFIDDYDSFVQGSAVSMEQARVNDEVWLPARLETNVRRSLTFGALAQPLITVTFSDHKKFGVETDASVTLPDAGR